MSVAELVVVLGAELVGELVVALVDVLVISSAVA